MVRCEEMHFEVAGPEPFGKDSSTVLDLNAFDGVFSETVKSVSLFTFAAFNLNLVVYDEEKSLIVIVE